MRAALRLARAADIPAIEALIPSAVMTLMVREYSPEQLRASLGTVFGVDRRVIEDGTYYVAEQDGELVGSGGWSFRRTLFGGDAAAHRDDSLADPGVDPARVRAFYVHPGAARSGVGSAILARSEEDATVRGFARFELGATLTGRPFYARHGYVAGEEVVVRLPGGVGFPIVHMRKDRDRRGG